MPANSIVNHGFCTLNQDHEPAAISKTVVVIGAPRGGTTMVAGCLAHLGVYMGENLSATYEDSELARVFLLDRDLRNLDEIIKRRDEQHQTWGWKIPAAISTLKKWSKRLRAPHYVVVFRDLLAVANRNRISARWDLIDSILANQDYYAKVSSFLKNNKSPALLVSYEKAIGDPEHFVRELASFINLGSVAQRQNAIGFIKPNSHPYLDEAKP